MITSRSITGLAVAAAVAALSACGEGRMTSDANEPDTGSPDTAPPSGGPDEAIGSARVGLRPLGDRDTFFEELRGALIARYDGGVDYDVDDAFLLEVDSVDMASPADGAATSGEPSMTTGVPESAADAGSEADAGDTRLEVTETNVQEQGVDEQDRVKVSADGSRLYVLTTEFGDIGLEGDIDFAAGDVEPDVGPNVRPIDGSFYGPEARTTLRVLGLDAASADATPLRDIQLDLGGRDADGMYLHDGEAGSQIVLTSTGGGHWGIWNEGSSFGGRDSVITRIDVSDVDEAAITGSFRVDGQIVSSRRIGKYLFFASRFYPTLPDVQPFDASAEEWQAAVDATDDASLLPNYTDVASDTRTPLVEPGSCFVAERPQNGWYSPDIVTIAVIDLDTMALADSECYLGSSETLYASPDAVYLATTRYDEGDVIIVDEPASPEGGPAPEPVIVPDDVVDPDPVDVAPRRQTVETDIHQFDIDGGSLDYRGSGSVRGHLGFDLLRKPFRMSARGGFLRVATVSDPFDFDGSASEVSPITVSVLEPDGNGALLRVAELPNADKPDFIGKPGERLYASRFIGDRAYLVTFRQTDPLYVIDLADPRDPAVLGELEIEGYSDYLMPIGEDHLLGIGRDAIAAPGELEEEEGAFVLGLKLSLFDVSDPMNPREADTLLVGQRGTQSEALFDHRGIMVQHATDEHPTRVGFGIDVAGEAFPDERPDPDSPRGLAYYDWSYTGLHGFDVTGGDGAGIVSRGAMVVERRGRDGQLYGPSAYGDRAVMVNDATYYVHGDRVYTATWDTLGNPGDAR